METAVTAPTTAIRRAVFEDALGRRHQADGPGGEPLEVFELRDTFDNESFERALRERVAALGGFHSTWFTQLRTVQRINQNVSKLFVVYDRINGTRLSTVLSAVKQPLDVNATLCLIRQLVAAVALLHEKLPNIAHGAIAAERMIITPKARLVVSDYVLGGALEQLRYTPDQYWNDLRVPLPNELQPHFDQRGDVMQIGILALELILGRRVTRDEYPVRIHELTDAAWGTENDAKGLPPELRTWLLRMLQLDTDHAFASAVDAWEDLEHVLAGSDNRASFMALESVVTEYMQAAAASAHVAPVAPVAQPAPVRPAVSRTHIAVASAAARIEPPPATPPAESAEAAVPELAAPAFDAVTPVAPSTSQPAPPPAARPEPLSVLHAADTEEPVLQAAAPQKNRRWMAVAAALALIVGGGAFFGKQYWMPSAAAEAPGTLVVTTTPEGVPVIIDGQPRGVTPLSVELAPGSHELRLETATGPRVIPFRVNSGSTVSQTLELPKVAPSTGFLSVRSEPAGARVTIDGSERGITPITIEGLTPGTHSVVLANDLNTVTQEVAVEAGATASLMVPMAAPQGVPVSGWISVGAPAEVQVFEDGRLVGTSQSDRIMVTAGRHEYDIVNDGLGYHARRAVTVAPGKVTAIKLDWPTGSMALNAQPWADVYINGQRVGETPIGNITVPIGTHEVTFRHPQLGEQVVRATVTAATPARVSVDMRKR